MTNSADPDQLASSEANWSGSTLFYKGRVYPGSAGQGLINQKQEGTSVNLFFLFREKNTKSGGNAVETGKWHIRSLYATWDWFDIVFIALALA